MKSFENIKSDFPIFERKINGKPLTYLDSGATSQKPNVVLEKMNEIYKVSNANVHRGTYALSAETTLAYEGVRNKCKDFINAYESDEIIFAKGSTEGFNFLANSISKKFMEPGDEIIVTEIEHHANIIPWQMVAQENDLELNYIKINEDFTLDLDDLNEKISSKTKVVSIVGESNLSGLLPEIEEITKIVKEKSNALIIIDGAQLVPHRKIDVQALGIDFLVFSGHKMLGPTGVGVLWGKMDLLNELDPFLSGGEMIEKVTLEASTWNEVPYKFEAGTPNYVQAIGMGEALKYLSNIGMENVYNYEKKLTSYALKKLQEIPNIKIYGNPEKRGGVISFNIKGIHPQDLSQFLNEDNICLRVGHHCAQPLLKTLNETSTARVSFYIYNDFSDIDKLVDSINSTINYF